MPRWYAFIILLPIIASSPDFYEVPFCFGPYAMKQDVKDQLVLKVFRYAPKNTASKVYDCSLEEKAGQILEDRHKSQDDLKSLGIYPLFFDIKEQHRKYTLYHVTHAAVDDWKKYIETVQFSTFGCNYRKEYGLHRFLCLFKRKNPY
ncbi:hypothetical protein ANCCAN_01864 [Ancylostoma caninum]|uniref:Uncharacterized protein n=1 Tax=Ancylostoma caninum TaxID=29170 RepID=A0A368H654_ANCCA|nr:hypothetical protein ANCCAN_01864 [Ancylostoma caninum]